MAGRPQRQVNIGRPAIIALCLFALLIAGCAGPMRGASDATARPTQDDTGRTGGEGGGAM